MKTAEATVLTSGLGALGRANHSETVVLSAVYAEAEALCKEYGETKGPGPTAKPSGHLFFRKLGSLVKNTLDKCQRENGFMCVLLTP